MAINFDRYKTYDDSKGRGSAREWRKTFHQRMGSAEAISIVKDDSPWGILEIEKGASQEEIKRAFRKLINHWHPDKNKSAQAEAMSKRIIAAYTILKK